MLYTHYFFSFTCGRCTRFFKLCSHPRLLLGIIYSCARPCAYNHTIIMAARHQFASVVCIVAWLALCLSTVHRARGVPVSEFYPFGAAAGDRMLDRSNDGSSQEIVLAAPFVLFGQAADKLFVRRINACSIQILLTRHMCCCMCITYMQVLTSEQKMLYF